MPASYDPTRPAPLLLALHGTGGDGAGVEQYLGLGSTAARLGFIYALPDGTLDPDGNSFWNATDACCDFFGSGVDDSAYLHRVIEAIRDRVAVDPKRIYVIGHSNGGFMSYRLACDDAGDIAAIVSLAGATYDNRKRCSPSDTVSVLEIHGTADVSVHYRGGTLPTPAGTRGMAPYPGAQATVQTWAVYDGCDRTPSALDVREDVATGLSGPHGPDEATMQAWSGCRPGGGVELWTVPGGPHGPTLSPAFPGAVLGFLLAHPKP